MNRLCESGQVIQAENGYVTVRMERQEACAACRGCIAGMEGKEIQIKALNTCNATKDDIVSIEMAGEHFLTAIIIMYGFPLLFLLTGFVGGYYLWGVLVTENSRELAGFAAGVFLMIVSYFLINRNNSAIGSERYMPRAAEKINKI